MLAAHNFVLGSCWIHRAKEEFESEKGKAILKKLGINGEMCIRDSSYIEEEQHKPAGAHLNYGECGYVRN